MERTIHTLEQLKDFAKDIVEQICFPSIILLYGEMGCGKTQLTQFVVSALKAKFKSSSDSNEVSISSDVLSPTFTLHNTYHFSNFDVEHFDLFRLKNSRDLESVGLEDVFDQERVIVVMEWADLLEGLDIVPDDWMRIDIRFSCHRDQAGQVVRHIQFHTFN